MLGYSLAVLRLFDRQFYRSMSDLLLFPPPLPFLIAPSFVSLVHTSRPTIRRPRFSLICMRIPSCTPFAARLCGPEQYWRYDQYLSDTYRWTGSQTIVRAAFHDCGTYRGSRCFHCCRDGDSPPCSSSPAMNPRSCLSIVTIGSLNTKCTSCAIINNLYLNEKLSHHRSLNFQTLSNNTLVWMPWEAHSQAGLTHSVESGVLGTDIPPSMFLSTCRRRGKRFASKKFNLKFPAPIYVVNVENTKERHNSKDRGNPVMQLKSRFKGMSRVKRTVETMY